MSRTFAPAQLAYLTARAAVESKEDALTAMCPDLAGIATEAELAAWETVLEASEAILGMDSARADLRAAKKALIAWAVESVAHVGTPDQAATIRALATNYRAQDRMVALAMSYAA